MKLENPECTRKMQQAGECRIDSNGEQHHNPNTKRMKVLGTYIEDPVATTLYTYFNHGSSSLSPPFLLSLSVATSMPEATSMPLIPRSPTMSTPKTIRWPSIPTPLLSAAESVCRFSATQPLPPTLSRRHRASHFSSPIILARRAKAPFLLLLLRASLVQSLRSLNNVSSPPRLVREGEMRLR